MGSCIRLRNSILTACSCLNIRFLIVLPPMTNEPHLRDRVQKCVKPVKMELRRRMHDPIAKTGAWLNQMLKGYLNYYAVSGNSPSLWWYFNEVRWRWLKSLKRRSQRAFMSWEKFTSITDRFFPSIRILHPLPCHRFDARTRGTSPVR